MSGCWVCVFWALSFDLSAPSTPFPNGIFRECLLKSLFRLWLMIQWDCSGWALFHNSCRTIRSCSLKTKADKLLGCPGLFVQISGSSRLFWRALSTGQVLLGRVCAAAQEESVVLISVVFLLQEKKQNAAVLEIITWEFLGHLELLPFSFPQRY